MTSPDQPTGAIRFYDNVVPPLETDDYLLVVKQQVTLPPNFQSPAAYAYEQRLRVSGPRFALAPGDVASIYPPASGDSDYSTTLPHVVLSRRTLPWEIGVAPRTDATLVPPWLAVLLLTPEEIVPPPADGDTAPADPDSGSLTGSQVVPVAQYLKPPTAPSGGLVVGPTFSADDILQIETEYPDLACTVVDVEAEAFSAVAPALAELPYLAHVRQTDTEGQEIAGLDADGWFALVVGNRLPSGSVTERYVAHLVSLEGLTGYLPGGAGLPAGATAVRLLSLASWTFSSREASNSFGGRMAALQIGSLRLPASLTAAAATPTEQTIVQALGRGYTAVEYQTRYGERTTGWYRGPCLPVNMLRNVQPGYPAAEAALLYDATANPTASPLAGLFDLSYAVAWQTGRLLALANRAVALSLVAWLRETHGRSRLLLERLSLRRNHPMLGLPDDVGELLAPDLVRQRTRRLLAQGLTGPPGAATAEDRSPLGPPRDPSGLLQHLDRLPGVLVTEIVDGLLAGGADPHHALFAQLRAEEPADGGQDGTSGEKADGPS